MQDRLATLTVVANDALRELDRILETGDTYCTREIVQNLKEFMRKNPPTPQPCTYHPILQRILRLLFGPEYRNESLATIRALAAKEYHPAMKEYSQLDPPDNASWPPKCPQCNRLHHPGNPCIEDHSPSPAFEAFMTSELEKVKQTGRLPDYVILPTKTEPNRPSNTPETDKFVFEETCLKLDSKLAEFARRLERERNAAIHALQILKSDIDHLGHWLPDPCRKLVEHTLENAKKSIRSTPSIKSEPPQ